MRVIGNFSFFGSLWMLVWTTVPRCRVSASAAIAGVSDFATKVRKCGLLLVQRCVDEGLNHDARTSRKVAQAQLQVFDSRGENTVVSLLR